MNKIIFFFLFLTFFIEFSFLAVFPGDFFAGAGFFEVFLLAVILKRNEEESLFWAGLGGIFLDYFSSLPWGTNALAFIAMVFLAGLIKQKLLDQDQRFYQAFVLMLVLEIVFFVLILLGGNLISLITGQGWIWLGSSVVMYLLSQTFFGLWGAFFYKLLWLGEEYLEKKEGRLIV